MENPIIVPFDLNTARKIKSGEIEGSVLSGIGPVLRAARPSRGTWSSPVASRAPATSTSETWFGR